MMEPSPAITIVLPPQDWAIVVVEMMQGAAFETARPFVSRIMNAQSYVVSMTAPEWNEVLAVLRNGRFAVVAPVINQILAQANAPRKAFNGRDADASEPPQWEPLDQRPENAG
jgi:hypothetical protein